ncbi:MAG: ligand-binding sensor domain-containing diguanylate cyclase [Pseudomarimonas sp.]
MRTTSTLEWRAFHSFSSADGLPQNSVLALLQDRQGFIYAGTAQGLARYDGQQWRPIELPTDGRRYAVGALAEAADGALWIGTDSQGAWRVHAGKTVRVALPDSEGINALLPGADGRVWVASYGGLSRCDTNSCVAIKALTGLGARSLLAETIDNEERLWVGTNTAGVLQLRDLQSEQPSTVGAPIDRRAGLPNNVGLSLTRFAGDLWIGSGRGLARFDGQRLHVYGAGNGFPVAMVFGLQASTGNDGQPLLLATLRPGGLAEIAADGSWQLIDGQRGLPANATHSLLHERYRDTQWVGTMTAGVARLERERWALFDERSGLPDRIVMGVGWSPAAGGTLWAGTANGAVYWREGSFVPLLPEPYQKLLVYDLLDAPDGDRWIAHGRGLQRWRDGQLQADFTVDNSALPAVSVDRLGLRRLGKDVHEIYIASGHGMARWRSHDGLRKPDDLPVKDRDVGVRTFATLIDREHADTDVLLVATSSGLWRLDSRGWSSIDLACLGASALLDLAAESHASGDILWLATRDGLLRVAADGSCSPFEAASGLGAITRVQMLDADLYAFGARGVLRIKRRGAANQTGELLGVDSGLSSPEVAGSTVDDRGRLFAASAAGLAALAPAAARPVAQAAPLHLLSAHFGQDGRVLNAGQMLSPDDSSVRFEFALLAFDRERALRYRVRLAGLQDEFGAWSDLAEANFPRLPPGQFELQVEARDADGVPATPIRFAFSVDTLWWQRPWALISFPLALLGLGLLLGRWRLHATRRKAVELEHEVAIRTQELAQANQQLEAVAVTDPLTGLKNRRYFALAAPAEAERARRAGPNGALLLAVLDIDHFKRINDGHGHDAGDAVLVEVARRLQQVARGGDFVFRWGGEEFLLLLRDVAEDAADAVLQRLLHALAATPIAIGETELTVTASIGAIGFPVAPNAPTGHNIEQAITLADAALYRAKREGRDRAIRIEAGEVGEEQRYQTVLRDAPAAEPPSSLL